MIGTFVCLCNNDLSHFRSCNFSFFSAEGHSWEVKCVRGGRFCVFVTIIWTVLYFCCWCCCLMRYIITFYLLNWIFFFLIPLSLPNSLKMEIEKLATEKTEMQRHYVMVSVFVWLICLLCTTCPPVAYLLLPLPLYYLTYVLISMWICLNTHLINSNWSIGTIRWCWRGGGCGRVSSLSQSTISLIIIN